MKITNETPIWYIKNWVDSAKLKVCSLYLTFCGLTSNRIEMPNFFIVRAICSF